jgi:hypothetical protein
MTNATFRSFRIRRSASIAAALIVKLRRRGSIADDTLREALL